MLVPATMTTLFATRGAVYRYNKVRKRNFRCMIQDDGLMVSERQKKSVYEVALKAVGEAFKEAQRENAGVDRLLDLVEDAIRAKFGFEEDAEEPEEKPEPIEEPEPKTVEPMITPRRRRA